MASKTLFQALLLASSLGWNGVFAYSEGSESHPTRAPARDETKDEWHADTTFAPMQTRAPPPPPSKPSSRLNWA